MPDTDGDGLLDGEEISTKPIKYKKLVIQENSLVLKDRFAFIMYSDPNSIDSEGDGISDANDNRPFEKGIYSEECGEVVVGELTIASSLYNSRFAGHVFLIYRSYIEDTLDFSGFTGGYDLFEDNKQFAFTEPCMYNIAIGEYVSLGNTFASMEGIAFPFEGIINSDEKAGNMFNREFAVEIEEFNKGGSMEYDRNISYSREITDAQMKDVLEIHNGTNYYNLLSNNCAHIATLAWSYGFNTTEFWGMGINGLVQPYLGRPSRVYDKIKEMTNSVELDMWEILKLK